MLLKSIKSLTDSLLKVDISVTIVLDKNDFVVDISKPVTLLKSQNTLHNPRI